MREFTKELVYSSINNDPIEGVIACGFLPKKKETRHHNFTHYGGLLILSGKGYYKDELGVVKIGQGDFIQRRPGKHHVTTVCEGEPWLEFYVCFGPKLYAVLVELEIISDAPILHPGKSPALIGMCEMLLYTFKSSKESEKKKLILEIQKFLLMVNQMASMDEELDHQIIVINQICALLSKNYDVKINFVELALTFQMGYENLRKVFKKQTGYTLHHYRIIKRIDEAKRLLHTTALNVKEIAFHLGYADGYSFSKQFKEYVHLSPTMFRRQQIGE